MIISQGFAADVPFAPSQPITWSWGQAKPTVNEYSWTNLSSMLWVEQPVGTGFSQGTPNLKVRSGVIISPYLGIILTCIGSRMRTTWLHNWLGSSSSSWRSSPN